MRLVVPGVRERRKINSLLERYYATEEWGFFLEALKKMATFYGMPVPKIVWRKKIERGRTFGMTYPNGTIHLIRPQHWDCSEELWLSVFYHEFGHYITWAKMEEKADHFDQKFRAGL